MKTKKYDPSKAQQLDTAARLQWNNPEQFVAESEIPPGARLAEIGCGSGWFTFALEKAVRPRGIVYALDMQPAMLQILRAKREHWERILTLPCSENSFELDDGEVDVVFHANTLHECEEPLTHLKEVNRVLKADGRLVLIEWLWKGEENHPGPDNQERLEPPTVQDLLQESGFEVQSAEDIGPYHYIIQAVKKS
jgi:ubiquinone/menaquinone biosynthesis C-methylase UbiE